MNKKRLMTMMVTGLVTLIAIFITSCNQAILNQDPLLELDFEPDTVLPGSVNILKAVVSDPDTDNVVITWTVSSGTLNRTIGTEVKWTAPDTYTDVFINVTATDEHDAETSVEKIVYVRNISPFISEYYASSDIILIGNSVTLTCEARDHEGTDLTYNFYSQSGGGEFKEEDGEDNTKTWYAPESQDDAGTYNLIVKVSDTNGESDADTIAVLVYSDYSSVWVVDSEKQTVEKYGKNGDKILTAEQEFIKPVSLANNTDEFYGCWVADYDAETIYKISAKGKTESAIENVGRISMIDIYKEANKLVCLNADSNSVVIVNTLTNDVINRVRGFSEPKSLTVNQINGDIWVCEPNTNQVISFSINDVPDSVYSGNSKCNYFTTNLNNPVSVAVGYKTPTIIYIVDKNDNEIERIEQSSGNRLTSVSGFSLPQKIGTSSQQNVYVIDQNGIYYFSESDINNVLPSSSFADTEFYDPHVIDIDDNGNVWIGDNGSKKLIRINPVGQEISISGFQFINDIVVNK